MSFSSGFSSGVAAGGSIRDRWDDKKKRAEYDEARVFVRAENRNAAKLRVKDHFPNANFFR